MATQIPYEDVTIPFIRSELSAGSNKVSELCTSPKINKWGVSIFGLAGVESTDGGSSIPAQHFQDTRKASQRLSILEASPYKADDFRGYFHPVARTDYVGLFYKAASSATNYGDTIVPKEGGTYEFWVDYPLTALKLVPQETWVSFDSSERYGGYSSFFNRYLVREGLHFTVSEWLNPPLDSSRECVVEVWTDEGDGGDVKVGQIIITQQSETANYSVSLTVNGEPEGDSAYINVPWDGGSYVIGVVFSANGIDWEYECTNDTEGVTNFTVGQVITKLADSPTANNDGEFGVLFSENPNTDGLFALVRFEIRTLDGYYTLGVQFRQEPNPIYAQ